LDTIERQSNGLLGSDTSAIIMRLEDQDNLKIRASTGRESWYAVPDLPKDRSAVGLALRQRKPALIRDVRAAYHAEPEQGRDWPEYEDLGDRLLVTYLPETGDAERAEMQ